MNDLHDDVFAISPDIRYVAAADGEQLKMRSRPDLQDASSSNSDLYEELLVNPTLLTLATRRGNIDCGRAAVPHRRVRPLRDAGHPHFCRACRRWI